MYICKCMCVCMCVSVRYYDKATMPRLSTHAEKECDTCVFMCVRVCVTHIYTYI